MTERTITAEDGTTLWARDDAPGAAVTSPKLPVVFLHGFSGSSSATLHLSTAVTRSGRRFVAPDLRGHGLSGKPRDAGAYAMPRFVSDVSAVADALGLERFHLAGHCMGGMVATAFGAAHPDRVASLTLIGTSLLPKTDEQSLSRAATFFRRPIWALVRRLFPAGREAPPHVDYSRFRRMGDVYWRRMAADWSALTAPVGERIVDTIQSLDLLEGAGAVAAPTLVVHGERDTVFGPDAARRTQAAIPGADLMLLPKDNHVTLVLDERSELFDALVAFADRAERAAATA